MIKYIIFIVFLSLWNLSIAQQTDTIEIVTSNEIEITFIKYQNSLDFFEERSLMRKGNLIMSDSILKMVGNSKMNNIFLLKGWHQFSYDEGPTYESTTLAAPYIADIDQILNIDIYAYNPNKISYEDFKNEVLQQFYSVFNYEEELSYLNSYKFGLNLYSDLVDNRYRFDINKPLDQMKMKNSFGNRVGYSFRVHFEDDLLIVTNYHIFDLGRFLTEVYGMYPEFSSESRMFNDKIVNTELRFNPSWSPDEVINYLKDFGYIIVLDESALSIELTTFQTVK